MINNFRINSFSEYKKAYKKSVEEPEKFWDKIAGNFVWQKKWDKTLEYNFEQADFKWFQGGQLNITENVLDRHLEKNGNKTCLLYTSLSPRDS